MYEEWLEKNIAQEENQRRRELLVKGLGHGTIEFLRTIWYPAVQHFDHLYPEWEVRDFHNGYRYIDLAYLRGTTKGAIEIQGYGPHARDLDVRRFKDLCWRHSLLALDHWIILPIAYLSIKDEPQRCQQLILSFIGRFMAVDASPELDYLEAETVRFALRQFHSFSPAELANHLRISDQYARRILHKLVDTNHLEIATGSKRYRKYRLKNL
ncbi:transcriptional regulator [Paenibacillus motobuensis]|uniref:transcriptional regulator n=1 Tax=Paenibacillus TaxID=44249 RepID=UPI0020413791|nr:MULTISPECIES: transcriptional regulator [Paenibacillus]MCM3040004.1 transcriptional regulator [Paenibacillus lutimineralis]MCM3647108.1 transcriptional regulator [Paenibacillus motobuensis]